MPDGIHEQYVRLLRGISRELDKQGGPELPTAWISGLDRTDLREATGLALDGMTLPDGTSLSEACCWDSSPLAAEFKEAGGAAAEDRPDGRRVRHRQRRPRQRARACRCPWTGAEAIGLLLDRTLVADFEPSSSAMATGRCSWKRPRRPWASRGSRSRISSSLRSSSRW